eukprot:COSAG06_NODE_11274_length_1534_cov_2.521254_1_plen_325_part_10
MLWLAQHADCSLRMLALRCSSSAASPASSRGCSTRWRSPASSLPFWRSVCSAAPAACCGWRSTLTALSGCSLFAALPLRHLRHHHAGALLAGALRAFSRSESVVARGARTHRVRLLRPGLGPADHTHVVQPRATGRSGCRPWAISRPWTATPSSNACRPRAGDPVRAQHGGGCSIRLRHYHDLLCARVVTLTQIGLYMLARWFSCSTAAGWASRWWQQHQALPSSRSPVCSGRLPRVDGPLHASSLVLLLYSSNDGWFSCSTAIATAEVVTAASGSVVITICCVLGPSPSPRGRDSQLWIVAPMWLLSSCRLPGFGLGFGQSVIN